MISQAHGRSLNKQIVMRYYLLPLVNHHQNAYLFSYRNYNDEQRLANEKPNQATSLVMRMLKLPEMTQFWM